MTLQLSLWNIHDWLDSRAVEHFYTLEDTLPLFQGIRFRTPEVDPTKYAVVYDVADNNQYCSILSFQSDRIYFRHLNAAKALNLLNELLFVFKEWQKKLTLTNLAHETLDELLSIASSLFRLPLLVIHNARIEACTEGFEGWNSQNLTQTLLDPDFVRSCAEALNDTAAANRALLLSLSSGKELLAGWLPFRHHYVLLLAQNNNRKITQADRLLFSEICAAVSTHLKSRERNTRGQYYNAAWHFFSSAAEGSALSADSLRHLLKIPGWQQDDTFQVSCIQFRDTKLPFYPAPLYTLLRGRFPNCYILIKEGRFFLFENVSRALPVTNETVYAEYLPMELLHIGQSNLRSGLSSLPLLARQAEQALLMAWQTGKPFVSARTNSTQAILKQLYADADLQAMVHPAILYLHTLDLEAKGSFGYLNTLRAFLRSGANISAAARELNLHRNTLINRIDRIRELTGLSLTDPKELEALFLSLIVFNPDAAQS